MPEQSAPVTAKPTVESTDYWRTRTRFIDPALLTVKPRGMEGLLGWTAIEDSWWVTDSEGRIAFGVRAHFIYPLANTSERVANLVLDSMGRSDLTVTRIARVVVSEATERMPAPSEG